MKKEHARHLLVRFGGLGDTIFLTCVAHAFVKHGITADLAVPEAHLPLLENNPDIGQVYGLSRIGPWGQSTHGPVNVFRDKSGVYRPIETLLQSYATGPRHRKVCCTDFFRIIETNGVHPSSPTGNSDYTNVYDLHLAWAGIDPALVPSCDKRPFYHATESEIEWAAGLFKGVTRPVVLWQPFASAAARSFYRALEVAGSVEKEAGGYHLLWDPERNSWLHHTGAIDMPFGSLRSTAALIAVADLLISADTFVSHLGEAVQTIHLTWYSTVSAHSRSRYYEYELTHDLHPEGANPAIPCKCHVITDARCPLVEADAILAIPDKDKALINSLPPQARAELNLPMEQLQIPDTIKPRKDLHPDMFAAYVQNVAQAYHISRHAEPYCMRGFDLAEAAKDAIEQVKESRRC